MRFFNEDSYQSDTDSTTSEIMVVDDLDLNIEEPKIKKKRIREKLDHLTNEEKLMRRKMKNRVSAQSARDRKKTRMQILEKKIDILCDDRQKILKENAILKKQNELIIKENSELKQRLSEIESRLSLNKSSSDQQPHSSTPNQLPIQIDQINQTSTTLPSNHISNDQIGLELNKLRSELKSTSLESAEFFNSFQQKMEDVLITSDSKAFDSKTNKRISNVKNKEVLILIKQLISLLVVMTSVKTNSSNGSKAVLRTCLLQTLKKLRLNLSKEQIKAILVKVLNRQVMADVIKMKRNQKSSFSLGKKLNYQKLV